MSPGSGTVDVTILPAPSSTRLRWSSKWDTTMLSAHATGGPLGVKREPWGTRDFDDRGCVLEREEWDVRRQRATLVALLGEMVPPLREAHDVGSVSADHRVALDHRAHSYSTDAQRKLRSPSFLGSQSTVHPA